MGWVQQIFIFLRAALRSQAELAAENLVLRQQLDILEQGSKRPRFLIRDRDSIYGAYFRQRVKHMGIEEVLIAYRWSSRLTYARACQSRRNPRPKVPPPFRARRCWQPVHVPTLHSKRTFPPR